MCPVGVSLTASRDGLSYTHNLKYDSCMLLCDTDQCLLTAILVDVIRLYWLDPYGFRLESSAFSFQCSVLGLHDSRHCRAPRHRSQDVRIWRLRVGHITYVGDITQKKSRSYSSRGSTPCRARSRLPLHAALQFVQQFRSSRAFPATNLLYCIRLSVTMVMLPLCLEC